MTRLRAVLIGQARLSADTIDFYADPAGSHAQRLGDACWTLGRDPN